MTSSSSWAGTASLATPEKLVVGGIPLAVYGLPALSVPASSSSGLAVLFLLHGRGEDSQVEYITQLATKLVESARDKRAQVSPISAATGGEGAAPKRAKDLLVVTFDQRNHGHRLVDPDRNLSWMEGGRRRAKIREEKGMAAHDLDNENHAYDMFAMQTGTARDVSFLMDFLAPSLFRHDERTITDWYCSGISLGGHATWIALAHDPRITLGVPIIGSPSTHTLLSHRARNLPAPAGPLPLSAPFFPQSFLAALDKFDPASPSLSLDRWEGKKILVLSGEEDKLVNFVHGKSGEFVEKLKAEVKSCHVEAWVQPGAGHLCTVEMMDRTCDFVWTQGLDAATTSGGGGKAHGAGGKL
ncbi:hypothetical protein JCM10908_006626 [Rhodotorula pacifica]|uniref:alpha/beta hydrolase family protein n=1 Tax=Rhodotorula pacifica TaxID=1495444 RepID=UPI00316D177F